MNRKMMWLFIIINMFLPLVAQQPLATEACSIDEAMVVTAQMEPVSARGSIVPVEVLPLSRIKSLAATNLDELLSRELGFRLEQHSVFGSSPSVRGVSGENVKILLDGVPIVGRLNGIIDLNHLVLDGVRQVEVIEGPASTYYGSDALGGVVNLISGLDTQEGSSFDFHTRYDSVGDTLGAPRYSYFNGKQGFSIGMGRKEFEGYDSDATTVANDFNERSQAWADLSYSLHLSKWDLKYSGRFFDENLEEPAVSRRGAALLNTYETQRNNQQLSLNAELGSGSVDLALAYADYRRDITPAQITDSGPVLGARDRTSFDQWLARGSFSASGNGKIAGWQLGFEATLLHGEAARLAGEKKDADDVALFASLRWKPLENLTIQPSLRAASNSNYDAPLTPALHAFLTDAGPGEWRGSVSRGFRGPSLKQQYLDFTVPAGPLTYHILGNEELLPEDGLHYNLSHVLRGGTGYRWRLQSELFYHDVDDLIALSSLLPDPENPGHFNRSYLNIHKNRGHGGELKLAVNHNRLEAVLGLVHTRSSNQLSATEDIPDYNGRTDLAIELGWLGKPTQWRLFYRGNGKSEGFFETAGEVHAEEIEAYHMVDVTAGRSLGRHMELTVGGKNLLDVESLDSVDLNAGSAHATNLIAWGRTWFVDLRLRWGK